MGFPASMLPTELPMNESRKRFPLNMARKKDLGTTVFISPTSRTIPTIIGAILLSALMALNTEGLRFIFVRCIWNGLIYKVMGICS